MGGAIHNMREMLTAALLAALIVWTLHTIGVY